MAQIKITLSKSPIGRKPEQRKTVAALADSARENGLKF